MLSATPAGLYLYRRRYLFLASVCNATIKLNLTKETQRTQMTTIICYENLKVDMIWGEYYHRGSAITPIELLDSYLSMEAVKFSSKCHESFQPIFLLILIAFAIERLTVFRMFCFPEIDGSCMKLLQTPSWIEFPSRS